MITSTNQFAGHQPGVWCYLRREEFIEFAGLAPYYNAFLTELQQDDVHRARSDDFPDPKRQAFWAAIAAAEAMRKFWPRDEQAYCESLLDMTRSKESSSMTWRYKTRSGTELLAIENRQLFRQNDNGPLCYHSSRFMVRIPAHRDLPDKDHYQKLRSGRAYNS
jgi:hypothetical protein